MGNIRVLYAGYRSWSRPPQHEQAEVVHVMGPKEVRGNFDVAFFAGWSWMVKDVDSYPCYCLHPSPLPLYRGGSPLQHQIIDGVEDSSVTVFRMTEEMDAGPIVEQSPLCLAGSMEDIYCRLAEINQMLFSSLLSKLIRGEQIIEVPQTGQVTTFKRRTPKQSEIDFSVLTKKQVVDTIRALKHPDYPNAYVVCKNGERFFL